MPWSEQELGGDAALLGTLGGIELLVASLEEGATVFALAVEELGVEIAREVVVMRDVGARAYDPVAPDQTQRQLAQSRQ